MHENFVCVKSTSNHLEAGLYKSLLESNGIQPFTRGETLNTITAEVSLEGGMIEIYVHKSEYQRAMILLADDDSSDIEDSLDVRD